MIISEICMDSFAVTLSCSQQKVIPLLTLGTDREIELIYDLQVEVLKHEEVLVACSRVLSELDW